MFILITLRIFQIGLRYFQITRELLNIFFVILRSKYDLEVMDFSCFFLQTLLKIVQKVWEMFKFCSKLKLLGSIQDVWYHFRPDRSIGGPTGGFQSWKKYAEFQFCCVQAKTTGNTASEVNNYLFVWLLLIRWCRLWPKNGWGNPPRGSSMLKKHMFRL